MSANWKHQELEQQPIMLNDVEYYNKMFDTLKIILANPTYMGRDFEEDEITEILNYFVSCMNAASELRSPTFFVNIWNQIIHNEGGKALAVISSLHELLYKYVAITQLNDIEKLNDGRTTVPVAIAEISNVSEIKLQKIKAFINITYPTFTPEVRYLTKLWKEFVWTNAKNPSIVDNQENLVNFWNPDEGEYYNMFFDPEIFKNIKEKNSEFNETVEQSQTIDELQNSVQEKKLQIFSFRYGTPPYVCCDTLNSDDIDVYDIFIHLLFPELGKEIDALENEDEKQKIKEFVTDQTDIIVMVKNNMKRIKNRTIITQSLLEDLQQEARSGEYGREIPPLLKRVLNLPDPQNDDSNDDSDSDSDDDDNHYNLFGEDIDEEDEDEEQKYWVIEAFKDKIAELSNIPLPPVETIPCKIPSDAKVMDYINLEEVPYKEYIEDSSNVVFFTRNNEGELFVHMGATFDELQQQISDIANFFYKCENENEGLSVKSDMIDINQPFFQLRGALGNLYVKVVDIYRILKNQDKQLWILINSGDSVEYTTGISSIAIEEGLNVFKEYPDVVSADHCQQGSSKVIYNIHPLQNIQEGGYRDRSSRYKIRKRKWW